MKIERAYRSATQLVAKVTLETEAERALTNSDLLLIVDNARGISFNRETGSYDLNGEGFGAANHFGGRVEGSGDSRTVTVYID